ncbi:PRTRC system ThiF family protein [Undibacterium arcticum]
MMIKSVRPMSGGSRFFPGDVGAYKAPTLINRINLGFNLDWSSQVERLTTDEQLHCEIVVGCVDNRKARSAILSSAQRGRVIYWLDCGNRLDDSQVILGEVDPNRARQSNLTRLPHAADLFPNLINASLDAEDGVPSCSLADALEKQSLFINSTTALHACNILSQLFRHGQIANHGSFVNLKTGRTAPLMVDEEAWKRFGYGVSKSRKKKRRRSKKHKKGRGLRGPFFSFLHTLCHIAITRDFTYHLVVLSPFNH